MSESFFNVLQGEGFSILSNAFDLVRTNKKNSQMTTAEIEQGNVQELAIPNCTNMVDLFKAYSSNSYHYSDLMAEHFDRELMDSYKRCS